MKLVILMYLRDDEACVERLLADSGVPVYRRMEMEGVSTSATPAGAMALQLPVERETSCRCDAKHERRLG